LSVCLRKSTSPAPTTVSRGISMFRLLHNMRPERRRQFASSFS
jgi:hypothetical protein